MFEQATSTKEYDDAESMLKPLWWRYIVPARKLNEWSKNMTISLCHDSIFFCYHIQHWAPFSLLFNSSFLFIPVFSFFSYNHFFISFFSLKRFFFSLHLHRRRCHSMRHFRFGEDVCVCIVYFGQFINNSSLLLGIKSKRKKTHISLCVSVFLCHSEWNRIYSIRHK